MPIKVSKFLLSSLLTWILMLPYWGSFSHIFEGHDHKTCEISETHLHEIELECDILDYHFSPSIEIFKAVAKLIAVVPKIKKKSLPMTLDIVISHRYSAHFGTTQCF